MTKTSGVPETQRQECRQLSDWILITSSRESFRAFPQSLCTCSIGSYLLCSRQFEKVKQQNQKQWRERKEGLLSLLKFNFQSPLELMAHGTAHSHDNQTVRRTIILGSHSSVLNSLLLPQENTTPHFLSH